MPTPTNIPTFLGGAGTHVSSPEQSRLVRSAKNASFLRHEGVLTARQANDGDTMPGEGRTVRIPRVVHAPENGTARSTLLQKWYGVVREADEETFTARLLDSNGELPPQQATFSRSELSPEEETQIAVGASFVWTIGYRHIGATRHRDSTIYFRRLPPWSNAELDSARNRAEKVRTAIGWE
ncbi:MAG: hypothetical protein JWL90_150 [Chthoniobacteraceae bacterium]|nr:hypothetical protein [Chthoniobacteraceae bacterium]